MKVFGNFIYPITLKESEKVYIYMYARVCARVCMRAHMCMCVHIRVCVCI